MTCVIWNLALVYLETVLVSVKIAARFAPNAPKAKKPFWTHPIVLQGQGAQVKGWFGLFGDSASLDAR